LTEDEGDFVAEECRGIGETRGKGVDSGHSGREGWWGSEVAECEHSAIAQEEGDSCVEEGGLELFYLGDAAGLSEWRRGIDGGEVATTTC